MNFRHYVFPLLLLLTACALPPADPGDFGPYLDTFRAEASLRHRGLNTDGLKIVWSDNPIYDGTPYAGLCDGARTVYIARDEWPTLSSASREQLLLHELGHCVLGKRHDDSHLAIMNTHWVSDANYLARRAQLIDDLFQ